MARSRIDSRDRRAALRSLAADHGVPLRDLNYFLRKYAADFGETSLLRNLAVAGFRLPAAANTLEYTFTKRLAVDALSGYVRDGQKVLSVGFGDGLLEVNLARLGCLVWGIEVNGNLVRIARGLAREAGLVGRCTFFHLRKRRYPFRARFVDIVLFSHSLHQIEDAKGAIRECHRVLKPGGEILILEDVSKMEVLAKLVNRRWFAVAERKRVFPGRASPRGLVQPVELLRVLKNK